MPRTVFHGHACFEIIHAETRVLIDPFLRGNPAADIGPDELGDIEAVLLTHGHADHLGDAIPICREKNAQLVATFELARFAEEQGVTRVHAMHIGGAHDFPWGRVKLVPALHGGSVEGDETGRFTTFPAGVILTIGGTRIYHAGDTSLTVEMQLLAGGVDLMLCPIGDNFTMGIEDAARAVGFVKPTHVIPMHYGTFPVIDVNPDDFVREVGSAATVHVLQPGEGLDL